MTETLSQKNVSLDVMPALAVSAFISHILKGHKYSNKPAIKS